MFIVKISTKLVFIFPVLQHFKKKAKRVGAVQPWEEKAAGRPYSSLSVPEGGL